MPGARARKLDLTGLIQGASDAARWTVEAGRARGAGLASGLGSIGAGIGRAGANARADRIRGEEMEYRRERDEVEDERYGDRVEADANAARGYVQTEGGLQPTFEREKWSAENAMEAGGVLADLQRLNAFGQEMTITGGLPSDKQAEAQATMQSLGSQNGMAKLDALFGQTPDAEDQVAARLGEVDGALDATNRYFTAFGKKMKPEDQRQVMDLQVRLARDKQRLTVAATALAHKRVGEEDARLRAEAEQREALVDSDKAAVERQERAAMFPKLLTALKQRGVPDEEVDARLEAFAASGGERDVALSRVLGSGLREESADRVENQREFTRKMTEEKWTATQARWKDEAVARAQAVASKDKAAVERSWGRLTARFDDMLETAATFADKEGALRTSMQSLAPEDAARLLTETRPQDPVVVKVLGERAAGAAPAVGSSVQRGQAGDAQAAAAQEFSSLPESEQTSERWAQVKARHGVR